MKNYENCTKQILTLIFRTYIIFNRCFIQTHSVRHPLDAFYMSGWSKSGSEAYSSLLKQIWEKFLKRNEEFLNFFMNQLFFMLVSQIFKISIRHLCIYILFYSSFRPRSDDEFCRVNECTLTKKLGAALDASFN